MKQARDRNQFRDTVREALLSNAEGIFRQFIGEPHKPAAPEWRKEGRSSFAMKMRGPERGLWTDHKSGEGGDLIDLIAQEGMGLSKPYGSDFPEVLQEAAKWAGVSETETLDRTVLDQRRAERDKAAEQEEATQRAARQTLVQRIADMVRPVKGSPAAQYLASRGITKLPAFGLGYLSPLPPTQGIAGPEHPALVVWGTDLQGKRVGGQRVLISPNGGKARLEDGAPGKPQFSASGVARFKGPDDKPLCVCEGPESALSVWQATGLETWAVFGVSGWASAPLPGNRKIILCPDRDAPIGTYPAGSEDAKRKESAARAFRKAKDKHLAAGLNIWIAEAPEPVGSKADLNDTLQRAGEGAVRDAIANAVDARPKPFHPRPGGDRKATIAKHSQIPRDFLRGHRKSILAAKAVKAEYARIDSTATDAERRRAQREARQAVKKAMGLAYVPTTQPQPQDTPLRALVSGAQGTGKTAALVGSDRTKSAGELHHMLGCVVMMTAPDHGKVAEAYADYVEFAKYASGPTPPAIHLRGRSAEVAEGQTACMIPKAAEAVAKKGGNVRASLCNGCPFAEQCDYLDQERRLKKLAESDGGAIVFAVQEYAFLPLPGGVAPDLVVMDEALRDLGAVEVTVTFEDLEAPLQPAPSRKQSKIAQAEDMADALSALLQHIQPMRVALRRGFAESPNAPYGPILERFSPEDVEKAIGGLAQFEEQNVEASVKAAKEAWHMARELGQSVQPYETMLAKAAEGADGKQARNLRKLFSAALQDIRKPGAPSIAAYRPLGSKQAAPQPESITACTVKEPYFPESTPVLLLDGTANHAMAARIYGELEEHYLPVERNAHITLVTGKSFSTQSITGEMKNGQALRPEEAAKLRASLIELFETQTSSLVTAQKRALEALASDQYTGATAHYGAIRGRNDWQAKDVAFVLPNRVPVHEVEKVARAFAGADPQCNSFQSIGHGSLPKERRGVTMADGSVHMVEVPYHPNPWGEEALRQMQDAELLQAIDRLRLIHNEGKKQVFVLGDMCLPLTVDRVVTWQEMAAGGSRLERAIEAHGVLPLQRTAAHELYPDIWGSPDTARRDLQPLVELIKRVLSVQIPNSIPLLGVCTDNEARLLEFQKARQPGKRHKKQRALVWAASFEAAKAKLEAQIGPLAHVAEVPGWIEARDRAADEIDRRQERAAIAEVEGGLSPADAARVAAGLPVKSAPKPQRPPIPPPPPVPRAADPPRLVIATNARG